jgi:shikimate kinase
MSDARRRVILIGMMGAGKTTVGHELSRRTGWEYLDNDELVRRAVGRGAPAVLSGGGEPELRRVEAAALEEALRTPPPVVVGVAAGTVLDPHNRDRMRDGGFVVYLRARLETLAGRVGSGAGRPFLEPDPLSALQRLFAGREPLYEQVASCTVDVDDLGAGEIADRILSALPDVDRHDDQHGAGRNLDEGAEHISGNSA